MSFIKITQQQRKQKRKIFSIFAFLFILGSLNLSAQNRKLTFSLDKVNIRQVFSTIEKQTDYKFLYRDMILDNRKDITIKVEGKDVTYVLDKILPDKDLQYKIECNNINIVAN